MGERQGASGDITLRSGVGVLMEIVGQWPVEETHSGSFCSFSFAGIWVFYCYREHVYYRGFDHSPYVDDQLGKMGYLVTSVIVVE